jgi:hypothetical protein
MVIVSSPEPSEPDSELDLCRRWSRSSTGVDFGRGGGITVASSSIWALSRLTRSGTGAAVDPEWRRGREGTSGTIDILLWCTNV